jgi:hypothetical protein
MARAITNIVLSTFGYKTYLRKPGEVDKKLRGRGIEAERKILKRLSRYTDIELDGFFFLIDLVRIDPATNFQIVKKIIDVDPAESVLEDYQKLNIDRGELIRILRLRVNHLKLNLKGIKKELEAYQLNRDDGQLNLDFSSSQALYPGEKRRIDFQVGGLINAIVDEAKNFEELANNPEATIEDVFDLIDRGKINLGFLNVAVYRPLGDSDGKWILTRRTRYWTEEKGLYNPEKRGHVPEGTLKSVLDGNKLIYDVDLCDLESFAREGLKPNMESIENDFEHAKGARLSNGKESRRLLYIRIQSGDRSLFAKYGIEGVILFHNQVARKDPNFTDIYPDPLLPEDEDAARNVKNILKEFYAGSIIHAIETIRRRNVEKINVPIASRPATERRTLYDLAVSSRKPFRFGKELAATRIYNPSTLPEDDQNLILETLNWQGRTKEDMRDHVINVAELEILFYKGEAVAFASGREVDHRNNGSSERMAYLIGTMVKDEFRGRSMQTLTNALFLMRRWLRYKFEGGFFKPLRPMMRSRSVPTIAGFLKYFFAVKFEKLEGKDINRAKTFARSLGCDCDDDGVVRNAYKVPVHDSSRDKRVLEGVKPKTRRIINAALKGLKDKDARIFQGKFNLLSVLMLYFYLQIIFRIKIRRFEKALNE